MTADFWAGHWQKELPVHKIFKKSALKIKHEQSAASNKKVCFNYWYFH